MDGEIWPGGYCKCACGYMLLVSAVDLCSMQPVLDVTAVLRELNIGRRVIMRVLALMALERLHGLSDVSSDGLCVHMMV